jgi:hypothetical protein
MARFPCDDGPHFHRGPNRYVYVAWGTGNDFKRGRLRLCDLHLPLVQEDLVEFKAPPFDLAGGGDWTFNPNCVSCFKPVDGLGWQVFVTSYPTNDQREDYWGRLHPDCRLPDSICGTEPI